MVVPWNHCACGRLTAYRTGKQCEPCRNKEWLKTESGRAKNALSCSVNYYRNHEARRAKRKERYYANRQAEIDKVANNRWKKKLEALKKALTERREQVRLSSQDTAVPGTQSAGSAVTTDNTD